MENIIPHTFLKRKSRKNGKSNSHEKNLLCIRNKKISLSCREKVKLRWVVTLQCSHDKTDKFILSWKQIMESKKRKQHKRNLFHIYKKQTDFSDKKNNVVNIKLS